MYNKKRYIGLTIREVKLYFIFENFNISPLILLLLIAISIHTKIIMNNSGGGALKYI